MSSNLKVNTILPSSGTTVAVSGIVSATSSVSIASSCTATTFYGSGANLTSLPAANLTGTLPAISGANLTSLPSQLTLSNNADNRVITGGSGTNLNGEANLTFNGGATGDAQLTVHAEQNDSGADSELILETSNDFATSVVMFKDSTAEAGSIAYNHGDNYIKLSTNGTNGGTERVRIDSSGRLLLGTTTEGTGSGDDLTISNSGNMGLTLRSTDSNYCNIYFSDATSGTAEYEGYISYKHATNSLEFATSHTERLRITSGGYVNIGGSSTQTTHLLHLQSTGDAGIHIRADSDNSGENDNPYLSMSQDGSTAQELKIGQNGDAGQNFALSLANSPFIHANHSAAYPLQLAHMDTMCVFISSRHNELGLNNYSGNTTAGMEIQNRGNDTATALKLTGHNNSGTPGAETFTQLTHIGSNLTFEIMHSGDRAFHIGSTRRIRVPGVWGVNGSSMRTVQIESDGNLCAPSSIREAKINIESISDVSWLYNFNPVTFNFRTKTEVNGENVWGDEADDGGLQYGLIADEVEAVNQDLCFYDDGKLSGVHYDRMMSPLIKAVQDQKKEIDALKAKVAALEGS